MREHNAGMTNRERETHSGTAQHRHSEPRTDTQHSQIQPRSQSDRGGCTSSELIVGDSVSTRRGQWAKAHIGNCVQSRTTVFAGFQPRASLFFSVFFSVSFSVLTSVRVCVCIRVWDVLASYVPRTPRPRHVRTHPLPRSAAPCSSAHFCSLAVAAGSMACEEKETCTNEPLFSFSPRFTVFHNLIENSQENGDHCGDDQ